MWGDTRAGSATECAFLWGRDKTALYSVPLQDSVICISSRNKWGWVSTMLCDIYKAVVLDDIWFSSMTGLYIWPESE